MADTSNDARRTTHTEDIDPAPALGRVGDGATLPSGEYISSELRELTERARAHRKDDKREQRDSER